MEKQCLFNPWLTEERSAPIIGWDFSHIDGRYEEEQDLPWDYRAVVRRYLKPDDFLLDMDTGGGEFLLSLHHPYERTSATENYPPNVNLCKDRLSPLGVRFHQADARGPLPFPDEAFDVILNRHGDYDPREIRRLLKPGGVFITEQVGAENDRELVSLLLGDGIPLPFPQQYLDIAAQRLRDASLTILEAQEAFRPIKFYDVGALVWFAHVIEWEFPNFSVEKCASRLFQAQSLLERNGSIEGRIHRYLLTARKP